MVPSTGNHPVSRYVSPPRHHPIPNGSKPESSKETVKVVTEIAEKSFKRPPSPRRPESPRRYREESYEKRWKEEPSRKRRIDEPDDRDFTYKKARSDESERKIAPLPKLDLPPPKKARHVFTIMQPYLDYIRDGIKTAEGRVNSYGYKKLRAGDEVFFHNRSEGIVCEITYLHSYKGFKEMLRGEGIKTLLPKIAHLPLDKALEEGEKIYKGFPGSDRVHTMGALAIGVKFIRSERPDGKNNR